MRGIKRKLGTAQRQPSPLLRENLFKILAALGDRPKDVRDAAILMIGFYAVLKRSELVGLDCEDIEIVKEGMVVTVRRSRTDQLALGRKIGLRFGLNSYCPISILNRWLNSADIHSGPLFCRVDRHGHILGERLSGEAVSLILKERVTAIGFNPTKYIGHSLRAGYVTTATVSGASSWASRKVTGHRSNETLNRYIRDASLFSAKHMNSLL